ASHEKLPRASDSPFSCLVNSAPATCRGDNTNEHQFFAGDVLYSTGMEHALCHSGLTRRTSSASPSYGRRDAATARSLPRRPSKKFEEPRYRRFLFPRARSATAATKLAGSVGFEI